MGNHFSSGGESRPTRFAKATSSQEERRFARFEETHPYYLLAREVGRRSAQRGFAVLTEFHYFFVRKLMLAKYSYAFIVMHAASSKRFGPHYLERRVHPLRWLLEKAGS